MDKMILGKEFFLIYTHIPFPHRRGDMMKTRLSKTTSKRKLRKKVVFEYYAPHAKEVSLAGTFNAWHPSETLLKRERNGKWKTALTLPSGRYEYRYRVDGSWQNDQHPVECVPNAFGTWNCVFEIQ